MVEFLLICIAHHHGINRAICVFSTVCGEDTILEFIREHTTDGSDTARQAAPWDSLVDALKTEMIQSFGVSCSKAISECSSLLIDHPDRSCDQV